ncbi:hypothetical protein [Legionella tucsonensis]|uniref:Uncharacterized protein n=1 Tax=Legionella tucsonensis TaxID=40335 RepID=A0A0W0ZYR5_9GAMM|nr:hypothetical protein [Legionella tucsonensis]KTD74121.1 hypothetical protein Ltuc_1968 [Legionella tucsonensis]
MKYKVQNNQVLDFCMSVELSDCQDIILYSPVYNKKAKEIYYNKADFTNINSSNKELLDAHSFFNDSRPAVAVFKLGGGVFHYFMVQKECVNNRSFYRVLQAYDGEYSLQDWLQTDRKWSTDAKEKFGKGQWLSQDQMQEFILNLKEICQGNQEAYFSNFGVKTTFTDSVFISVNHFLKKFDCQEHITVTLNPHTQVHSTLVENSMFAKPEFENKSYNTPQINYPL